MSALSPRCGCGHLASVHITGYGCYCSCRKSEDDVLADLERSQPMTALTPGQAQIRAENAAQDASDEAALRERVEAAIYNTANDADAVRDVLDIIKEQVEAAK